jgi:hypothetical protein
LWWSGGAASASIIGACGIPEVCCFNILEFLMSPKGSSFVHHTWHKTAIAITYIHLPFSSYYHVLVFIVGKDLHSDEDDAHRKRREQLEQMENEAEHGIVNGRRSKFLMNNQGMPW